MTAAALLLLALAGDADADAGRDAEDGGSDAVDAAHADAGPSEAETRAETVTLRGRVLEKGTRRPMGGAAVWLDAAPAGETDATGRFELRARPGTHHVQVQAPAHEIVDLRVELAEGVGEQVFRLAPIQTGERYETTVQAGRAGLAHVDVSGEEARKTPGASGDPLRVVASLPGVSQIVWPAALFVVRGANPGNTAFFLDGMRVPALFHLALGPSIIHPYLIGGVDFYPGGFPASFGGAASGIVSARTAPTPVDRVHAAADVTLYDASGVATAPWNGGRGTVVASVRGSYTGALLSALSLDTVLRYGDYQLRVDHALAGGQATVFAFGSLDELGSTVPGMTDQYAALQFHRVDVRWRGPAGRGRLVAAVNVGADRARSTLFMRPIKVRALSAAPRISYERALGRAVDLQVGAEADARTFVTEVPAFQPRQSDLGRSRGAFTQAAFASLAIRAGRFTISPGARGSVFFEQSVRRFAAEPRLNLRCDLSERVALKAAGGRFVQMPSLPVSVPGFEAFGLADLGLQSSVGGSLGVEARLPRGLAASVTGYGQRVRLTDVRNIDLAMPDPTAPDFLVSRNGVAAGVEVLVRRANEGRLFGWLAYTLSWSLRVDDNGVLGRSDWDQRHMANLVAGYRLRGGYSVGGRLHYHTGRYAPIFDSGGEYRQLPSYHQLDLRADRRFIFDRFVLDVFVDVGNVTFSRQVLQLVGQRDPSNNTLTVQEAPLQIILPTIGVHGEF